MCKPTQNEILDGPWRRNVRLQAPTSHARMKPLKCQSYCSEPVWTNIRFSLNSSLGNLLSCVLIIRHDGLKSVSCIPGNGWIKSIVCKSVQWLRSVITGLCNATNLLALQFIFLFLFLNALSQGDHITYGSNWDTFESTKNATYDGMLEQQA